MWQAPLRAPSWGFGGHSATAQWGVPGGTPRKELMFPEWAGGHPTQIFKYIWRNPPSRGLSQRCSRDSREGKAPYTPSCPDPTSRHHEHHKIQSSQSAELSPWSPTLTWPPGLGRADSGDLTSWPLGGRGQRSQGAHLRDRGQVLEAGAPRALRGLVQQHGHPSPAAPWGALGSNSPAEQGRRRAKSESEAGRCAGHRGSREGLGGPARAAFGPQTTPGHHLCGTQDRRWPLEAHTSGTWRGWGPKRPTSQGPAHLKGHLGGGSSSLPQPMPQSLDPRPDLQGGGEGVLGAGMGTTYHPSICEAQSSLTRSPTAAPQGRSLTVQTF